MDKARLIELLTDLREGRIEVEEALSRLRHLPYEDLGYAKLDHHRSLRRGFAEVILCSGKTTDQIVEIAERLMANEATILATRATPEVYGAIRDRVSDKAQYNQLARTVVIRQRKPESKRGSILVVSAGTSDIPVAEEACVTAEVMGNRVERLYDVGVAGIHRLLDKIELLRKARCIVVVAGMEGALASVIGGLVDRPIIAVPTSVGYGASFGGLAALLAMLNSCSGGVAVVNIDNGFGAGQIASLINASGQGGE